VAWRDDAVDLVWLAVDPIFLRRRDQLNECGFSPAAGRDRVLCGLRSTKARDITRLLLFLDFDFRAKSLFCSCEKSAWWINLMFVMK
jgi:hypothetical protein